MMVLLLGAVTSYAWIGFSLYAVADWKLMRRAQESSTTGYIDEFIKGQATFGETANFRLRILFDFYFPLLYGGFAVYRVFSAWHLKTF